MGEIQSESKVFNFQKRHEMIAFSIALEQTGKPQNLYEDILINASIKIIFTNQEFKTKINSTDTDSLRSN